MHENMKSRDEREGNVGEVIDRRVQVYGDPIVGFARIAEVWSGILGFTVNATDVPLCMIGLKLVRANTMPDYSDNSDDVEGYLDIFRQLVGDEMIHARTVNEFIEKKWGKGDAETAADERLAEELQALVQTGGNMVTVHVDGTRCVFLPEEQEYRVAFGKLPGSLCVWHHDDEPVD